MNFAQSSRRIGGNPPVGLALVVGLHIALAWALMHGLATTLVKGILPPPIDARIDTVKQPPPPPLPDLPVPRQNLPQQHSDLPLIAIDTSPVAADAAAPNAARDAALPVGPGADAGPAVPPAPPAPRPVARPAIANVQACAPTSDDYPAVARRAEATGITRLRFTIDAAGALMRSEIVRSAGASREHRLLDQVAQSRLAGCAFTPGIDASGRPVGGTFEVDYVWKLE